MVFSAIYSNKNSFISKIENNKVKELLKPLKKNITYGYELCNLRKYVVQNS